jgi:hypothetical protein
MGDNSHPLIEPRAAAALALASICGVGWGLIAAQFIAAGLVLSFLGSAATLWLYLADVKLVWAEIRQLKVPAVPRELWVGFGIIGVNIAVPAYLAMAVPAPPTLAQEAGGGRWIIIAVTYAFAAAIGFFYGFRERPKPPQDLVEGVNSASLYVAEVLVDVQHLQADLYVEICIRAFNSSGETVSIQHVRGELSVATCPKRGGSAMAIGRLPTPRLLEDRTQTRSIADRAEIFLVFEQRVPRVLADTITATLDAGDQVQLGLSDLDVMFSTDKDSSREVRVKIWNGVSLMRWSERVFVGRIFEAQGHATLRGSASIGS